MVNQLSRAIGRGLLLVGLSAIAIAADVVTAQSPAPSTQPAVQDSLDARIKVDPGGGLSFYVREEGKLKRRFMITPEGGLVAGGVSRPSPNWQTPETNEPHLLDAAEYDNAKGSDRLAWINDFYFGLNKKLGAGGDSEGQPALYIRVLALMGRTDSPDIQLGRTGPDNGPTMYGSMGTTPAGTSLGKIIFKAYSDKSGWTGDIAGIHARNTAIPTREKSPASLHFTTAGESVNNNAWRENIERVVIQSNGYVGIGDEFSKPTERLHVKGNILSEGNIVATGAKKFVINHPTQPGMQLAHAAIEGPEAAVYYRGKGRLVNGRAVINLPRYFEALTLKEERTVILTNMNGFDRLAVEGSFEAPVKDGTFVVVSDQADSSQAFFWEVKAIRSDVSPLTVER